MLLNNNNNNNKAECSRFLGLFSSSCDQHWLRLVMMNRPYPSRKCIQWASSLLSSLAKGGRWWSRSTPCDAPLYCAASSSAATAMRLLLLLFNIKAVDVVSDRRVVFFLFFPYCDLTLISRVAREKRNAMTQSGGAPNCAAGIWRHPILLLLRRYCCVARRVILLSGLKIYCIL